LTFRGGRIQWPPKRGRNLCRNSAVDEPQLGEQFVRRKKQYSDETLKKEQKRGVAVQQSGSEA